MFLATNDVTKGDGSSADISTIILGDEVKDTNDENVTVVGIRTLQESNQQRVVVTPSSGSAFTCARTAEILSGSWKRADQLTVGSVLGLSSSSITITNIQLTTTNPGTLYELVTDGDDKTYLINGFDVRSPIS